MDNELTPMLRHELPPYYMANMTCSHIMTIKYEKRMYDGNAFSLHTSEYLLGREEGHSPDMPH